MNIVEQNIDKVKFLCKNHGVDRLYLFGSFTGTEYNENSDIDLLVRFRDIELLDYADNYFDLKFSLEDLFKRPVDLLEEQSLRNPYFISEINESKRLIYGS